ncbi:MAG: TetR/AcrR family transcriptional regulator [Rhizomicrobium sp.]
MISIFQKLVRKGGRRRRLPDGKVPGIIDAGIRLLARKDYEAISIARIAREAGCSVGAFYARFPDKNSYLYHLVASAYRTLAHRAETELEAMPTRHLSLPSLVRLVVERVVNTMTAARAAGVIRATIKLSTVKPITIELFEDYRKEVTRLAIAVLAPRLQGNSTGPIRLGMQMVFATVTDAVLQPRPGPMVAGTKRMKDALTQVMLGYLGVSKSRSWAGEEAEGADEAGNILEPDDADQDYAPNDINAVFDPDLRTFHKTKGAAKQPPISKRRKSKPGASPPATPVVKPPNAPKGPPDPHKPKRRHRII